MDCFRKTFRAEHVAKARLYIIVCGLYDTWLNGCRAGDFCMAPGHTDYRKRVQLQTYDVTALLQEGDNELTVQLADGWCRGSCLAWGRRNQYGTATKLLAQLEVTRTDGTMQTIATDGSWAWSNDSPICFADNRDGETANAPLSPAFAGKARETRHPHILQQRAGNGA